MSEHDNPDTGRAGNSRRARIVAITGPTASGKTRASLAAAEALRDRGREVSIISMDAVQVYRHMDIGSDKLPLEQRRGIPHHMIDVADPDQTFSAAEFARRADQIIAGHEQRGAAVVLAGGTGFYLRALVRGLFPGPAARPDIRERLSREAEEKGLAALHRRLTEIDPPSAARVNPADPVRVIRALEVYEASGVTMTEHFARQERSGPRYDALVLGLAMDRAPMYERINARAAEMLGQGLVAEVENLRAMGYGPGLPSQQALGYRQVHMFLDGEIDFERCLYLTQRDTRRFARRQLTWFRKEEGLEWVGAGDLEKIAERTVQFLGKD